MRSGQPWTIEKGETLVRVALNCSVRGGVFLRFRKRKTRYGYVERALELKYRVVLFTGTPKEAGLDNIFENWLDAY